MRTVKRYILESYVSADGEMGRHETTTMLASLNAGVGDAPRKTRRMTTGQNVATPVVMFILLLVALHVLGFDFIS